MKLLTHNFWTIAVIAAIVLLTMTDSAAAQDTLIKVAERKAATTFRNVKSIIFIVGGFGLVLLAFGAIFGKIKWSAFASLAVGLAILAAAGAIVEYATGADNIQDDNEYGLGDSFGKSAGTTQ